MGSSNWPFRIIFAFRLVDKRKPVCLSSSAECPVQRGRHQPTFFIRSVVGGDQTYAAGPCFPYARGTGAAQTIQPLHVPWERRSLQVWLASKSPGSPVVGGILVNSTIVPSSTPQRPLLQAQLLPSGGSWFLLTLLDSGADVGIINEGLVLATIMRRSSSTS